MHPFTVLITICINMDSKLCPYLITREIVNLQCSYCLFSALQHWWNVSSMNWARGVGIILPKSLYNVRIHWIPLCSPPWTIPALPTPFTKKSKMLRDHSGRVNASIVQVQHSEINKPAKHSSDGADQGVEPSGSQYQLIILTASYCVIMESNLELKVLWSHFSLWLN